MNLAVADGSTFELATPCACKVALVDIAGAAFRFRATLCSAHPPQAADFRIGVRIGDEDTAISAAERIGDRVFEAVLEIDYLTQRLSGARLFAETEIDGAPLRVALTCPPSDLFSTLQVDSLDAARVLVRRRRSRRHGFAAQLVAAYQSYLYGVAAGSFEVIAFSLCSIGWRAIQRERALEPGAVAWVTARIDELLAALGDAPEDYARWKPSLCTVMSQLALVRGDFDRALRYADEVIAEPDVVERCPISAYNVVLNLCLATYVRYWRDPADQLDFAMIWETLFPRIVAAMDIRFGTMYEFKVIYDVTFMVTRLTLIRRGHVDPRLKPVTFDEFAEGVFRVALGKVQRRRIMEALGVVDAPAAAAAPA